LFVTVAITLGIFFMAQKGQSVLRTSICVTSSATWKLKLTSKMSFLPSWKNFCGRSLGDTSARQKLGRFVH